MNRAFLSPEVRVVDSNTDDQGGCMESFWRTGFLQTEIVGVKNDRTLDTDRHTHTHTQHEHTQYVWEAMNCQVQVWNQDGKLGEN